MSRLFTLALAALCLVSLGFEWEGRLGRLRRDLASGDAARRREVVRLLGSYPASEVGEAILGALDDPDAGVRAEAANSAGRVQLRGAVQRLLDWLDDGDADVRTSAARALGRIADPRTVSPLVRALGDSNADVRRAAVDALANIGTPDVVIPLLGRLDDARGEVRIDAARVLGVLGDARAVVPLVGRARDEVPEVRIAVYAALGEIGDARGLAALLMGLRDSLPEAQLMAIAALGRLGAPAAVEPLSAALVDPDARRGRAIVAALGSIRGEAAVEAVIGALGQPRTRALASEVLASRARRLRREDPEAREAFVLSLTEHLGTTESRHEATAVARLLSLILDDGPVPAAAPPILRTLEAGRADEAELLAAAAATGAPDVLVPILARLRTEEEGRLEAALTALELYFAHTAADGRAADPLLTALGRIPSGLRVRVVRLLGIVRARRALPGLRPLLDHPDRRLRQAAVEAIGAIGDPEGAEAILALLDDRDGSTRFEAARALGAAAGVDTAMALVDRLADEAPTDRHAVIEALGGALVRLEAAGELQDARDTDADSLSARARSRLAAAANGRDSELAARAIDALGRWGAGEGAPVLRALLAHQNPSRRRAAAHALGGIDTDASRDALRSTLAGDEEALRAAAVIALGTIGTEADVEAITLLGASGRWPTEGAAAFALARLSRRGLTSIADAGPAFCSLAARRGPYVRANVAMGLAALGAGPCPDGLSPEQWLENRRAAPVQVAAARWLAAAAAAGTVDAALARRSLDQCVDRALSEEVAAACATPELPPLEDEADIYAWSADGHTLLRDRLVALRLADGSVMLARTDDNGHVRLPKAPTGRLVLDDPAATPLEPARAHR